MTKLNGNLPTLNKEQSSNEDESALGASAITQQITLQAPKGIIDGSLTPTVLELNVGFVVQLLYLNQ